MVFDLLYCHGISVCKVERYITPVVKTDDLYSSLGYNFHIQSIAEILNGLKQFYAAELAVMPDDT